MISAALRLTSPTRGTCDEDHPVEDFAFKSKAKRTLQSRCRAGQAAAGSAWYDANTEHRRAAARSQRARLVAAVDALVDDWLAGRSCGCGATDHLVAVGSTGRSLKWMVKKGWNLDIITVELPNALVRCRLCSSRARLN